MTTPPKPDHEKRPFRFKLEGPFLRVSTMLLITPISPNFKGLKCSVFGRFRALQSRKNYGITTVADLEKPEQVWPVFLELTQDIGHKLRVHGLSAEGVAIHIRDNTLNTRQWQTKIALPTQSPMIIAKTAFQLFEKRYGWNNPIRSVTVQAINLVPQDTPRQIDMFMDAAKQDKLERMEKCVEEIRRRFGKDSIRNGVLCQNLRLPPKKAEITMPTGMVG